jgi:hypothetical protein
MTSTAILPTVFIGRAATDPVTALAVRMGPECRAAVDVDEVAALLEASGVNDRLAVREYGTPTVFALATLVLARATAGSVADDEPVEREPAGTRHAVRALTDTVVRALLYLTPLAVGIGTASKVDGLPALAVSGTLIAGWGAGQALSYLGYRRLSDDGAAVATRLLAAGFVGLAVVWTGILMGTGTPWPVGFAVAGMQLVFFASVAVALVTGRERRVLATATLTWLTAAGVALGGGYPAMAALAASLLLLLAVAYLPGWVAGAGARKRVRWRAWRGDVPYALRYGAVGTGQAVLLVALGAAGVSLASVWAAVPLLLGVPLIELTLVWHQRRIASARAALDDRAQFERRLSRVSASTAAVLAIPVAGGGLLASAAWLGKAPAGAIRLAAAVLLVAVYALCLVLAAHRRPGTAATLVWWPALLVGIAGPQAARILAVTPQFADTLAAATLLGAAAPGLVVAAQALRNPESYR